jgi:hypothetical protein
MIRIVATYTTVKHKCVNCTMPIEYNKAASAACPHCSALQRFSQAGNSAPLGIMMDEDSRMWRRMYHENEITVPK